MYRKLAWIVLFGALLFGACGEDDEPLPSLGFQVMDFSATVPNLSPTGYTIGQIQTDATQPGSLSFSLVSETLPGAFAIGAATGELSIADGRFFDHNQHPIIAATVEIRQGERVSAASITIAIDELTAFQLQTVDYFKDIALGFDIGELDEVTRKWRERMKIHIEGPVSDSFSSELNVILAEIHELVTDDFEIELVESIDDSNFILFLGSLAGYWNTFPEIAELGLDGPGIFRVRADSADYLESGHMLVDITETSAAEQRHLLREGITRSLGLGRASDQYDDSIFQSERTLTSTFSALDRELIRLLYHPDMSVGLNETAVEAVIRQILASE